MSPDGYLTLAADKAAAIRREFGAESEAWIAAFPNLLGELLQQWQLRITGQATAGLPINVVYFVTRADGVPLVLKFGYPHPEQRTEMSALELLAGRGIVRLEATDRARGAVLLEAVIPGTQLRDITWQRSRVVVPVLRDLPRPVATSMTVPLPTFAEWLDSARTTYQSQQPVAPAIFGRCLDEAWSAYAELAESSPPAILHGDLHHENLLYDGDNWVAIDPKGVIAPPLMECGRFLHNFLIDEIPDTDNLAGCTSAQIETVLEVRIDMLSDLLEVPGAAVARAGFIDLCLACCWTVNAGGPFPAGYDQVLLILRRLSDG